MLCRNTLEEVTFNADDLRAYAKGAAKDTKSTAQDVAADAKSEAKNLADKVWRFVRTDQMLEHDCASQRCSICVKTGRCEFSTHL